MHSSCSITVFGNRTRIQLMFECVMHVFQGVTNPLGRTVCSFDPEGQIFAAGVESQTIKLYDLRAFDKVTCKTSFKPISS